jgi:uncharacterized NAD(P)/FAD-binding protein YdhS
MKPSNAQQVFQHIAVVGGGAAGAAVVGEFLRAPDNGIRLTWLAGGQSPGRGVAYGTDQPEHVLNVRAANMGLLADDSGAFLRFAQACGVTAEPTDFLPRSLFGDYVQATLAHLLADGLPRCRLEVRSTEALAIQARSTGGYDIQPHGAAAFAADSVVLAVGALPPVALPQVDASALGGGRYAIDPWNLPRLPKGPQQVVVIGSRLTAIDTILSAAATWPHARIIALSRHGCLPGNHWLKPQEPYAHQAELIEDLRASGDVRHWLRIFRKALATDQPDWRSTIDGLRPVTNELWRSLDLIQRGRFLRHVRWLWDSARHRMPPQTARTIHALQDEGRLQVIAGRVRNIGGAEPVNVAYRDRRNGSVHTIDADLVVQATGFESTHEPTTSRLLRQMLEAGLVCPDPLGLGLHADVDGRLLRSDGSPAPGLRAVGTLLRGTLWESTSMPEIRAFAAKLAREVPEEFRQARADAAHSPWFWQRGSEYIDKAMRSFSA